MRNLYSRRDFLLQCLSGGVGILVLQKSAKPGLTSVLGSNDRFRVAVVGLGRKGLKHIESFYRIPDVEICAICDHDAGRLSVARSVIEKFGRRPPIATTDYRRIADLKELDAVSIAVPSDKRVEIALDFCSAGKDMLLERPFSLTALEGRVLVDAANREGRLVQQRDEGFVFSQNDELSAEALNKLGSIRLAKGWKNVSGRTNSSVDKNHALQVYSREELIDESWCELDMARCVLAADVPQSLTTRTTGHSNDGNQRVTVEAVYPVNGISTRIEFEVWSQGYLSTQTRSQYLGSTLGSFHQFIGKHGSLKVSTDREQEQWAEDMSFVNFIRCVKERRPDQLLNPIKEARKSNLLIELTKYSLAKMESIEINPKTEVVIGSLS